MVWVVLWVTLVGLMFGHWAWQVAVIERDRGMVVDMVEDSVWGIV